MRDEKVTIDHVLRDLRCTRLEATCQAIGCGHRKALEIDKVLTRPKVSAATRLDELEAWSRCDACGAKGTAEIRPDWSSAPRPGAYRPG